jgi:hypothetical protein
MLSEKDLKEISKQVHEDKALRDRFAMAALPCLAEAPANHMAAAAYEIAQYMMEASRDRHDMAFQLAILRMEEKRGEVKDGQ